MIQDILSCSDALTRFGYNRLPFVFTVLEKWSPFYRRNDGIKIFKFLIADASGYAVLLADARSKGEYFHQILQVNEYYQISHEGARAFSNKSDRRIRCYDGEIRTIELWLQGHGQLIRASPFDYIQVKESAYSWNLNSIRTTMLSSDVDEFWALLPNVRLEGGILHRYFGCPLCKSSMRSRDSFGRAQCPFGHGIARKFCFRMSDVSILENGIENDWFAQNFIGFTMFDDASKMLLDGREATEFENDNEAEHLKERNFMLNMFDIRIVGECRDGNWKLTIKDISVATSQRSVEIATDNDSTIIVSPAEPTPSPVVVGFHEITEPLVVDLKRPAQPIEREDNDFGYEIRRHPKGSVLIINNMFNEDSDLRRREGSSQDVLNVSTLHTQLGYRVHVEQDVRSENLDEVIQNFQREFADGLFESCFLYIMSHGTAHTIELNDNNTLTLLTFSKSSAIGHLKQLALD